MLIEERVTKLLMGALDPQTVEVEYRATWNREDIQKRLETLHERKYVSLQANKNPGSSYRVLAAGPRNGTFVHEAAALFDPNGRQSASVDDLLKRDCTFLLVRQTDEGDTLAEVDLLSFLYDAKTKRAFRQTHLHPQLQPAYVHVDTPATFKNMPLIREEHVVRAQEGKPLSAHDIRQYFI